MKIIVDDDIPILDLSRALESIGCVILWTIEGLRISRKPKRKRRTKFEMKQNDAS